jgi:hypothetical protein
MRAKPRGHVGPRDRADMAGRYFITFVILNIYTLASALDLVGLSIIP